LFAFTQMLLLFLKRLSIALWLPLIHGCGLPNHEDLNNTQSQRCLIIQNFVWFLAKFCLNHYPHICTCKFADCPPPQPQPHPHPQPESEPQHLSVTLRIRCVLSSQC